MITTNPKKILLADDSMMIRARLGHILEEAGHNVTLAFDGAAVIETLSGGNIDFDLIIIDINLPHINGFAVLEWMNLNGFLPGIPVLCMADFSDINKVTWKSSELGSSGTLIKGLTHGQTIDAVNKILFKETKPTRFEDRIPTSIETTFDIGSETYDGTLLNISNEGIFLKTDIRLFVGSTLSLKFSLPFTDNSPLTPKGIVKWITPLEKKNEFFTGAGIEFKVITEKNKILIKEFLANHKPTEIEEKQA